MPHRVLEKKHPLAIRWFHWINFPVIVLMAWSGMLIVWANNVFTAPGLGKVLDPGFFMPRVPDWVPAWVPSTMTQDDAGNQVRVFYDLQFRLAEGLSWHFLFAWIFAINGLLYAIYLLTSGEWRRLVPKRRDLKGAILVVLHDLRLYKGPIEARPYNAAQKIAYSGVFIMGAAMLVTGIAIYKPASQGWLTQLIGGYTVAKFIHFWTTILFALFFVVHVSQVVKAGWNNFRGMVTGYELVTPEETA